MQRRFGSARGSRRRDDGSCVRRSVDQTTNFIGSNPFNEAIVEQEEAEREDDVIEKRVIRGEDNSDFKRRDDAKAGNAKRARQKEHPDEHQLDREREEHGEGVETMREVLHVPADPGGKRAILVVVVHGGEMAPGLVTARELRDAGFEVDAKPFPAEQEKAEAGRRVSASEAWQQP